jgi:hypothetical protein
VVVAFFCFSLEHLGHHIAKKEVALIKAELTLPKGLRSRTKENSLSPSPLPYIPTIIPKFCLKFYPEDTRF